MVELLLTYVEPREAVMIVGKMQEAPRVWDLVPRLSQSSDNMAKVLKEEAPLFI